jgi:WD40 repeat protein
MPFKISDCTGIPYLSVICIATFDRKITLYDVKKSCIFMTMNLEDSSAHTIKYSPNQSVLFVSTFDKAVKVYSIDISKDYTLRSKLESPASITCFELCDDENLVITCDDKAHIKTWDTRTFRNVQQAKLNTQYAPGKIVHLTRSTRFCVISNRLNFFMFTDTTSLITT